MPSTLEDNQDKIRSTITTIDALEDQALRKKILELIISPQEISEQDSINLTQHLSKDHQELLLQISALKYIQTEQNNELWQEIKTQAEDRLPQLENVEATRYNTPTPEEVAIYLSRASGFIANYYNTPTLISAIKNAFTTSVGISIIYDNTTEKAINDALIKVGIATLVSVMLAQPLTKVVGKQQSHVVKAGVKGVTKGLYEGYMHGGVTGAITTAAAAGIAGAVASGLTTKALGKKSNIPSYASKVAIAMILVLLKNKPIMEALKKGGSAAIYAQIYKATNGDVALQNKNALKYLFSLGMSKEASIDVMNKIQDSCALIYTELNNKSNPPLTTTITATPLKIKELKLHKLDNPTTNYSDITNYSNITCPAILPPPLKYEMPIQGPQPMEINTWPIQLSPLVQEQWAPVDSLTNQFLLPQIPSTSLNTWENSSVSNITLGATLGATLLRTFIKKFNLKNVK